MADHVYRLAATDIEPTRDLTPSGTFHNRDGVGTTVCGLELMRQVRMFPDGTWDYWADTPDTCPVCAEGVKAGG